MGRAGGAVVAAGPALAALRAVIPTRGRPTIPIRQPLAAAHRGARAGRSLTLRAMAAPALMAAAGSLDAPHKARTPPFRKASRCRARKAVDDDGGRLLHGRAAPAGIVAHERRGWNKRNAQYG